MATAEPIDRVLAALRDRGRDPRQNGAGWTARCPSHDDNEPSLSVSTGDDGTVLVKCHAGDGCDVAAIVSTLGLDLKDLFRPSASNGTKSKAEIVATYDYVDESGELLYQVCRLVPKSFRQRRPDGRGGWTWKLGDVRRVPFRLPSVLEAVAAGRWVLVVEGEKDVLTLERHGFVATCNSGGAGKWPKEFAGFLRGARVAVIPDNDTPGERHADQVASSLKGIAEKVVRVAPLSREPGGDVTDWLAAQPDTVAAVAELKRLISGAKAWEPSIPSEPRATAQPLPTEPPELARDQAILDRFRAEVRGCGVVGEDATAATLYLLITSRLLDKPVSAAVKGHSSSGKSFTTEATVRFFPPEAVIEMTAMSERALVYSSQDYQHRTLVLYEATALREGAEDNLTAYFVRSLLSEGRIEYPVTVRGADGNFTTKTIVKKGPTNLIVTTTKTKVHAENETRLLSLATDDSREQTKRVLYALADETDHGIDLSEWHALQSWLQHAEHRVTIPYAKRLAELVPPVAVRLRRDFGAVLALIRSHAILHQANRERDRAGRIVATVGDYAQVRELVADVIAEGVGTTVSPTVRETVDAVATLANEGGVTARAVSEHLELDKSNVSRRLRMAAEGGYLRNLEDKRGRPGRWVVGDPLPEQTDLLPQPRNLEQPPDQGSCAVARVPEGENHPPEPGSLRPTARYDSTLGASR